jgi:hypothetical protein
MCFVQIHREVTYNFSQKNWTNIEHQVYMYILFMVEFLFSMVG